MPAFDGWLPVPRQEDDGQGALRSRRSMSTGIVPVPSQGAMASPGLSMCQAVWATAHPYGDASVSSLHPVEPSSGLGIVPAGEPTPFTIASSRSETQEGCWASAPMGVCRSPDSKQ